MNKSNIGGEWSTRIDILVANLPYIASSDIAGLQPEVREFEPHLALDGGTDGLLLYRRLIAQIAELPQCRQYRRYMQDQQNNQDQQYMQNQHYPRLVCFEVGLGQADEVRRMLEDLQVWERVTVIHDLAGIPRHVMAVGG